MTRGDPASAPAYRVGVDTGGTFTDLVLIDGESRIVATHKLLSTPADPARAVLRGLGELLNKAGLDDLARQRPRVVHGSTVATNALLEGKTAPTALLTTAGFEDTLAIARQDRPDLYDLVPRRPEPPILSERCLGVAERIAWDGSALLTLDDDAVDDAVERVDRLGVESVAISLLHSYANGEHEQRLRDALRRRFGDSLHITVSHELLPEFREYERAATCAVNAVIAPVMGRYLGRLTDAIGEDRLRIMASHGGTLPPAVVRGQPIRTVLSGPAGGVLGAADAARQLGVDRVITLDMGGTSTDVALIDREPTLTTEGSVGPLPVRLPMIDMHTVGAGGGSIARVDPGGALRVGPQSTGADPGPACYGKQRGEPIAAVTDAHVVLGHIPSDRPLGDGLHLDAGAARRAVQAVADRAELSLEHAADGILRIAEATMARAVQRISLQRGRDPRGFALMPFGGAGGLHACRLAESLGMGRVIVPVHPGLLSAVGMLGAAPRYTFSQTVRAMIEPGRRGEVRVEVVPAVRDALEALKRSADEAMAAEHVPREARTDRPSVDLRYSGQSYELNVPLNGEMTNDDAEHDPLARFEAEHERLYGYAATDRAIEVVTVRWQVDGSRRPVVLDAARDGAANQKRFEPSIEVRSPDGTRRWWYVRRDELCAGDEADGPGIVAEYSATTLVRPGWRLRVHETGQFILERSHDTT